VQLAVDRAAINRSTSSSRLGLNATLQLLLADLDRCCPPAALELRQYDSVTPQDDPSRTSLSLALQTFYRAEAMVPQEVVVTSMPVRANSSNGFFKAMHSFVPLFIILAYIFPLGRFVRVAVWEKEAGLVDSLRAAGVSRVSLILSWPAVYAVMFSAVALLAAALGIGTLFSGGDFSLLFLMFMLYGFCCTAWGVLVIALTRSAKTATLVGTLSWLALALPFFGTASTSAPPIKAALGIFAPTALSLGLDTLGVMTAGGQAPTWGTVNVPVAGYAVSTSLVFLAIDCLLYWALALYLGEVVAPRADRPAARPWHFLCSCAFRRTKLRATSMHAGDAISVDEQHSAQALGDQGGLRFAQNSASALACAVPPIQRLDASVFLSSHRVSLRHVTKVYSRAATAKPHQGAAVLRAAVDDVSIDLLPGQISVLLGANGAGKTTLVSIMSQDLAPTSGSVRVWGEDVTARGSDAVGCRSDASASSLVAVCPQHDPLWPELTVAEHVSLLAAIKGGASDVDCAAMLANVGLAAKAAERSSALSGGMKRRLCVALALLGDSKLILLDEPTTGELILPPPHPLLPRNTAALVAQAWIRYLVLRPGC
jgi:ATP-binding cassette, subfamily A (ABC1), member 3